MVCQLWQYCKPIRRIGRGLGVFKPPFLIELNWIELNWIELNWIELNLFPKNVFPGGAGGCLRFYGIPPPPPFGPEELFFFWLGCLTERLVMYYAYPYTPCLENWPQQFWGRKKVSEYPPPPPPPATFSGLARHRSWHACNFTTPPLEKILRTPLKSMISDNIPILYNNEDIMWRTQVNQIAHCDIIWVNYP